MAEFGWAYVAGGAITGAAGPTGSIQVKKSATEIGGYDQLIWNTGSNTLELSGDLSASVNISASAFYGSGTQLTSLNATNISTGTLNNARLPANINVTTVSASTHVSASTYYGVGSNITSLNASNISAGTLNNARLPAAISVTTVSASTHVSASTYYGDGSNLSGISSTLDEITDNGNSTTNTITIGGFTATGNSVVTGSLTVSGSLYANELVTNVTNKNVVNISATGSTTFGDTTDDKHVFTGKVGIGTTNPSHTLQIDSNSSTEGLQVNGAQNQYVASFRAHTSSGKSYGPYIRGGTNSSDSALVIDNASGASTYFKITGDGKVGIGTANPSKALHVQNSAAHQLQLHGGNSFWNLGAGWSGYYQDYFLVANNTGEKLVIDTLGRVGIGTSSPTKKLEVSGDMKISGALSGSSVNLTGLSAGTAATSSFLALDSNNNIVLTSSAGGGGGGGTGQIGAAEDGDYTDGLFTDFTTNTLIGVPVDRFNEVLKILAPSPAPGLSRVNSDNSAGTSVKLSFGSSNDLSDYTSSNTTAGFSAVNVNGIYENSTSGSNFRLGAYKNNTDITGFLNFHVAKSVQNGYLAYSNDAFGNAETGSLKLELNGNVIHTVNLASLVGAGNPFTGSANSLTGDSGFTNVSVTASSFDGNNSEWYIFKHRTAKIKVDVNDMIPGWNYVRAIHTVGSTDYATNYIEWINDPSGAVNDLSVANPRIENITLVGSKHLSGVEYNTDATANYKVDVNNLYRNVYAASGTPISFSVTNSTTPSAQAVPAIGGGETHTKIVSVTASLNCNTNSLVSGAISANVTVTHPFKNTISATGSATTGNGFLIDNRTLSSTNTSEKFHDETHRKQSGSFNAQSDVTGPGYDWNSQTHMTAGNGGHSDGLIMFNQRLYSPIDADIPKGGNFSGLLNVESGQPDYSSVSGTRTFYRKIQNTSGASLFNFKIESTKNGTTYNNSSLGTGNVHVFAKIPGTTGWMDVSQAFTYGAISDGNGALVSAASDSDTHVVTFGTASVADDAYIMLKILADESWQGYISQLDFTLPANQNQATPGVLSDLEADSNTGTGVKLSFGSSNAIGGYSNVQGGGVGSMSTINSNGDYIVTGNRRGAFSSAPTIEGELNEAVSADGGGDFPAKAFFNGYSGSLVLEINGSDEHTINLNSTLSAINTTNGNGSRLNVSAVDFSTESSIPNHNKPYRTGTYQIAAADQRPGWNYARIKHGSNTTNYVEWVVDASGAVNNSAVSTPTLSDFGHTSIYYQSGIGYFASRPTGSFTYSGSNFYSNVYSRETDAISFGTTTNCSISNIRAVGDGVTTFDSGVSQASMPALDNSADCEATTLQVTGTVLFDHTTSISGGLGIFTKHNVSVDSTLKHPFKTNRTTSAASKIAFMVYSGSIGSTNLNTDEYFNTEDYRIVSGNYVSQSNATSSANSWNPQTHMNAANAHGDGMVTVNGFAISPLQIGVAGNTSHADLQAPAGNPNYSTLSDNVRTYYRYFRNTTGLAKATGFSVKLYGDATLCAKGGSFYTGALGANKNINVELKVPFDPDFTGLDDTSTAWGDVVRPYQAGVQPTTDGVGIYSGGNSDLNQTVGGSGRAIGIQLLEKQIRNNQYFVLKISAHKDWTGYLSRIEIVY